MQLQSSSLKKKTKQNPRRHLSIRTILELNNNKKRNKLPLLLIARTPVFPPSCWREQNLWLNNQAVGWRPCLVPQRTEEPVLRHTWSVGPWPAWHMRKGRHSSQMAPSVRIHSQSRNGYASIAKNTTMWLAWTARTVSMFEDLSFLCNQYPLRAKRNWEQRPSFTDEEMRTQSYTECAVGGRPTENTKSPGRKVLKLR